MAEKLQDRFADFLKRLARVPKEEIDEQEQKYQESKKRDEPAQPRKIVPADRR